MLEREGMKLASIFLRGDGSTECSQLSECVHVHARVCVSGREKKENV